MKRLRGASDAEQGPLEQELDALKSIDHHQVAHHILRSKLVKARLLPKGAVDDRSTEVQAALGLAWQRVAKDVDDISKSFMPSSERELGRILSNKALADVVSNRVESIRTVFATGTGREKPTSKRSTKAPHRTSSSSAPEGVSPEDQDSLSDAEHKSRQPSKVGSNQNEETRPRNKVLNESESESEGEDEQEGEEKGGAEREKEGGEEEGSTLR